MRPEYVSEVGYELNYTTNLEKAKVFETMAEAESAISNHPLCSTSEIDPEDPAEIVSYEDALVEYMLETL